MSASDFEDFIMDRVEEEWEKGEEGREERLDSYSPIVRKCILDGLKEKEYLWKVNARTRTPTYMRY